MELIFALFIGFLFGAAVFSLLRRSIFRVVIGVMLLAQAANLMVFSGGGLVSGRPPIIPSSETILAPDAADPLPQALVLTAIVIGFGLLAFMIALVYRAASAVNSPDLDDFDRTEVEE
jgi:multicomponent Na+:H+ antiporter subunit C